MKTERYLNQQLNPDVTESQVNNLISMEKGLVMQSHKVTAFKLLSNYYSSNKNRKKRYSMDDPSWRVVTDKGFWYKVKAVLAGAVHKLYK